METDWQGPGTDSPTASRACTGGTSVESTGLEPSATGDAGGHSSPDSPEGESDHSNTRGQPPEVVPKLAVWAISGSATDIYKTLDILTERETPSANCQVH